MPDCPQGTLRKRGTHVRVVPGASVTILHSFERTDSNTTVSRDIIVLSRATVWPGGLPKILCQNHTKSHIFKGF